MSSISVKAGTEFVFKATGPAARRIADGIAQVGKGVGAGTVGLCLGAGSGVSNVGQGVREAMSSVGQGVGEGIASLGEGVGDALSTGVAIAGAALALEVAIKVFEIYGFPKDCKKGSLFIVVVTKSMEATQQLFNDYFSGEVLKNLNKALRDAFSKEDEDVLTFDGLSLEETKSMRMTEAEYEEEERKAEWYMNHLITAIKQQPVMQLVPRTGTLSGSDARHSMMPKLENKHDVAPEQKKIFNDPVHGTIEIRSELVKVIDTPQFQRLRNIKQLGACHFYYPGACHTRFEHSIGTCYLAGKFVRHLKSQLSEDHSKLITPDDVLAVELAALCHNLGHGPFCYMFSDKFMPRMKEPWNHKEWSCKMLDELITENQLQQYLEHKVVEMAKELIKPPKGWEKSSAEGKEFLYEILCNERNGVDVNQFDYFARDCHHVGQRYGFDHERFMKLCRVVWITPDEDGSDEQLDEHQPSKSKRPKMEEKKTLKKGRVTTIAVQQKASRDLFELFHTKNVILKSLCKNRVISVIENMICDAMDLANEDIKIKRKKLSEVPFDQQAFTSFDDSIFYKILHSEVENEDMESARQLLQNILNRNFYQHLGSFKFPLEASDSKDVKKLVRDMQQRYKPRAENAEETDQSKSSSPDSGIFQGLRALLENLPDIIVDAIGDNSEETKLPSRKVVIDGAVFEYGTKHENPCEDFYFYKKEKPNEGFKLAKEDISETLPNIFAECELQVLYRKELNKHELKLVKEKLVDEFNHVIGIIKNNQLSRTMDVLEPKED